MASPDAFPDLRVLPSSVHPPSDVSVNAMVPFSSIKPVTSVLKSSSLPPA